jgi:DNA primase
MRGVWNEEALVASKQIILCEALIDALTFWCAGFRHVTTSYGINGFTDEHRAALQKHGTERVYIAYDHDEAGNKAAAKLAAELMQAGIECFRVEFPKGMDANAHALKTQPASLSLGVLLNSASWLGKGQRPASPVAVPGIVAAPEKEPAAKEKMIEEETAKQAVIVAPESVAEPLIEGAAEEQIIEEESILAEINAAAVAPVEELPEPTEIAEHVLPLAAVVEPSPARPMPLTPPTEPQV